MTWREEAKELGIKMWQRKKIDVLRDIELKKVELSEPQTMKITVDARKATEICKKALYEYVSAMGMKDATCEKWYLNCKRKGIVFKGMKDDTGTEGRTEDKETKEQGTGADVPSSVSESQRKDNPERPEETSGQQQGYSAFG